MREVLKQADKTVMELSYKMAINEAKKVQLLNNKIYLERMGKGKDASLDTRVQSELLKLDNNGYKLSLEYQELLFRMGYKYCEFAISPDIAHVNAESLMNVYGYTYPEAWHFNEQGELQYESPRSIEANHEKFNQFLGSERTEGKITQFDYDRLIQTSNYYSAYNKLYSKYLSVDNPRSM